MKNTSILEKNPALGDISIEEIQELLKEKQAAAAARKAAKRKEYEDTKQQMISDLGDMAAHVRDQLGDLKYEAFRQLTMFRQEMLSYGDIKGGEKNKGSFQLKNDAFKIEFSSQVNKCFDERAELAEAKLKEFLTSMVKKRDASAYKIIMALLERNEKTGDFDIDLINRLYKMENDFDNPLWKEAIAMFKESYSPYGTAQYIKFSQKNAQTNTWDAITLDFAKLKTTTHHEKPATNDEAKEA